MVARAPSGETKKLPTRSITTKTKYSRGVPCRLHDAALESQAQRIACGIAQALQLEGLLAVEISYQHIRQSIRNELAPRPHNSYHASRPVPRHQRVRTSRQSRLQYTVGRRLHRSACPRLLSLRW